MAILQKYLYGIVGLFLGAFLAFFLCHSIDFNPLNDEDDSHVLEFHSSTTYEVKTQSVAVPPASKEVIKGQPLTESEKRVFINHRGLQSHTAGDSGKQSNTKEGSSGADSNTGPVTLKDNFFKIIDSAFWSTSQLVTAGDTSFYHYDSGYYYFSFQVDCLLNLIYDFKVWTSPVTLLTINTNTIDVVTKRPWFRLAPFVGVNALNTSEWRVGINAAIRYGDFWAKAGAEYPMQKDPKLALPVTLEYDLITLER